MTCKDEGSISNIIYEYTAYNKGKYRHYLTVDDLISLLEKVINTKMTTESIRIVPFYSNCRLKNGFEFEDDVFFLSCRDSITIKDREKHWTECMDKVYDIPHAVRQYNEMDDEEKRYAQTMYPICLNGDAESYAQHIKAYQLFLMELIPKLYQKVFNKTHLSIDDAAFGYFCFEVNNC